MLDLLHDLENELGDGWEAASRAELQNAEHTRRAVARVTIAMWMTVCVLLLFNSERLVTWVNGFEVGPVQDVVVALSTSWNEQMNNNGFNEPSIFMRGWINELRATSWDEVEIRTRAERARTSDGVRMLRGMLNETRS